MASKRKAKGKAVKARAVREHELRFRATPLDVARVEMLAAADESTTSAVLRKLVSAEVERRGLAVVVP